MIKLFSYKNRPVHLGPFPMESLRRSNEAADLVRVPEMVKLRDDHPYESLAHPLHRYLSLFDILRDSPLQYQPADITDDPVERTNHLKAASYFYGASMVGACALTEDHLLSTPIVNPNMTSLCQELKTRDYGNVPDFAEDLRAYISNIPDLKWPPIASHKFALVILTAYTREPRPDEPGSDWIHSIQAERAAMLGANTGVMIANYIRALGYEARLHTATTSDVDLNRAGVSSGLCLVSQDNQQLVNPFLDNRFGLTVITTTLELAPDKLLAKPSAMGPVWNNGIKWATGYEGVRSASNFDPYLDRDFLKGPYPYEKIKRVDKPTSFMDEERIPRVPARADFFSRAVHGDLGKKPQISFADGMVALKSPISACGMISLMHASILQYGPALRPTDDSTKDPKRNAENVKATGHFLKADAMGISRMPEWAYYSHDSQHREIPPEHINSIAMLLDQGHETMEGASGDDWVSAAQSMQSYVNGSVFGGVIAEQLRRLGYSARVHTAIDGQVVQPPLLLLAGLAEISRIGDTMLNPYLGPRVKSLIVTTSFPMIHDKPIDFGLQTFCNNCNKCARECPSGAITAGPKVVFNGYEIWRSDSEKCTRYRTTNEAGAMCGRCMKTCPWNLEGLFSDEAFRWMAINAPSSASMLAKLDDSLNRGTINPVKKWWWDLVLSENRTKYVAAMDTNKRQLQKELKLRYEDQTLAAYPADLIPPPMPLVQPVNRDEGIERYRSLPSVSDYKAQLSSGHIEGFSPQPKFESADPPVFPVKICKRSQLAENIVQLELCRPDGSDLPPFQAGAHIDVYVAPHLVRQFSLCGNPSDLGRYTIGIKRENQGRGGSLRLFKGFREGKTVFISTPRNHFPLEDNASFSLLMAGGIGVTPLIAMAHRLHTIGSPFLFHYSDKSAHASGYASEISCMPWCENVFYHFSQEGGRAVFSDLIPEYRQGFKLYICGGDQYMNAVQDAAKDKNWPQEGISLEYFSVPDQADRENFPFKLKLVRSDKLVLVPAELTASEALADKGIHIDVKCSDGLCGVCTAKYLSGNIDHRDFVLSAKERNERMALCCSRTLEPDALIEIDM